MTSAVSPLWPFARSVDAKQTIHDACPALVMNIFEPLTTYSSPRRTAVVWMPDTSEPAPGSVSPKQPSTGASTSGPSHSRFCSSVPASRIGADREAVRDDRRPDARAAPVQLLPDEDPVEARERRARRSTRGGGGSSTPPRAPSRSPRRHGACRSSWSAARGRISFAANSRASARKLSLLGAQGERDPTGDA